MADDVRHIVLRAVPRDPPQHATDKLRVRRQGPERPEDRGDREGRVIIAFAQQSDLHDHVRSAALELPQHRLSLGQLHPAVDQRRRDAPGPVERHDLPGMGNGASRRDRLVRTA